MEGAAPASDDGGDGSSSQLQPAVGGHGQKIPGGRWQGIQVKRRLASNRPLDATLLEVGNPRDPVEIRAFLPSIHQKEKDLFPFASDDHVAASRPEGLFILEAHVGTAQHHVPSRLLGPPSPFQGFWIAGGVGRDPYQVVTGPIRGRTLYVQVGDGNRMASFPQRRGKVGQTQRGQDEPQAVVKATKGGIQEKDTQLGPLCSFRWSRLVLEARGRIEPNPDAIGPSPYRWLEPPGYEGQVATEMETGR